MDIASLDTNFHLTENETGVWNPCVQALAEARPRHHDKPPYVLPGKPGGVYERPGEGPPSGNGAVRVPGADGENRLSAPPWQRLSHLQDKEGMAPPP